MNEIKNQIIETLILNAEYSELKYIKTSIEFIIENYEKMFGDFEKKYLLDKEKLKENKDYRKIVFQGNSMLDFFEEQAIDRVIEYENMSNILISSIWIKQVAYIEKFLTQLADISYDFFKCKIAPKDFYNNKNNTDCIKSVKYIKLVSNNKIDIESMKNYQNFLLLRGIRHRLAHGKNEFILKNKDFNDINKIFSDIPNIKLLDSISSNSDDLIKCKLNNNLKNLLLINYLFLEFEKELVDLFLNLKEK